MWARCFAVPQSATRHTVVDGPVRAEVVTDSWRTQAPKHLLSEVDGG